MTVIICIFLLIFVMGIFIASGKGAFLISGYNTMSKSEKAKYDEKAYCRFTGLSLILISFCLLLIPIGVHLEMAWLIYCGIVLILVVSIAGAIYTNTSKRFLNNTNSEIPTVDKDSKFNKKYIIVITTFSLITTSPIGILLYQGNKEPIITTLDNSIQIQSIYGLNIDFSEITDVSLIDDSMRDIGIGRRINGYGGISETLKGHFKSDKIGDTLLFVQSKSSPTIRIERNGRSDIYISFHNTEKTKQLYNSLSRNYR